jgi:hypothetical protein
MRVALDGCDDGWHGSAQLIARATPVTDPARVSEILDMFRAKYGAPDVAAYYRSRMWRWTFRFPELGCRRAARTAAGPVGPSLSV